MNYANGNSFGPNFGESLSPGFGEGHRHTVPPWLLGLRQSDDRGGM